MNSLRTLALSTTVTFALLAAALLPQAQAQTTQRIEVTGSPAPARYGDADEPFVRFANPRTRAEVRAELMAYLAAGGHVYAGGESGPPTPAFVSSKTRAEVMAEAAASRARGDFERVGDETVLRRPTPAEAAADTLVAQSR